MKYFLGYSLEGEARWYHEELTRELSEKFTVKDLNNFIPPHITIIRPFEAPDILLSKIESILETVCRSIKPFTLQVNGFMHFGKTTIGLKIETTRYGLQALQKITKKSTALLDSDTGYLLSSSRLHASVARYLSSDEFKKLWEFISKKQPPYFALLCNHITIFEYIDHKWVVYAHYKIGK